MDHVAKGLAFVSKRTDDFDGDGSSDIAVYRDGVWFALRSSNGGLTVTGWEVWYRTYRLASISILLKQ